MIINMHFSNDQERNRTLHPVSFLIFFIDIYYFNVGRLREENVNA